MSAFPCSIETREAHALAASIVTPWSTPAPSFCYRSIMRVLIIEDNARLAQLSAHGLDRLGFACDCAASLTSAKGALDAGVFDLVVLDLGLPDGDGLDWLRAERGRRTMPPVLIVTARDGLEDRVSGLDAGGDDYLVKPFAIEELAARLRALARRPGMRAPVVIEVGLLRFDSSSRSVTVADRIIETTRRETDLLELLMRRAGTVVRKGSIEDALYSFDEAASPNAVEAVVSRLRRRLEAAGAAEMLHTVRGVGYLLREPVI